MNTWPQTIQIFLPNGSPTGIRIAELTTRIVQVIDVPRKLLAEFLKMPERTHVAVYYLVAESDDGSEPQVYIGQTGDLATRLLEHDTNKDFWERVLVLVSRTHSMTQTHALYLEWLSLKTVREAGRYTDLNGNAGSRPYTPAPMEADCGEIFTTGRTLLTTLGHPLFEAVTQTHTGAAAPEYFFCRTANGDVNGKVLYTEEGFVMLAGSVGRRENVPSIVDTSNAGFRDRLIAEGVMKIDGEQVVFTKDHLFRSPSRAALALLGRTANGWLEWKDERGRTLHEVKRLSLQSPD